MTKSFCKTHHFYYATTCCPFCTSDRVASLDKRFNKVEKAEEKRPQDNEVTEADLELLKDKFSNYKLT